MQSTRAISAILMATVMVLAAGSVVALPGGQLTAQQDDETNGASVTFEEQTSNGTTVVVDEVTVPEGGFVTMHDSTLLEGEAIGSVVGVSEYLEPGTHENVTVDLFDVEGIEFAEDERLEDGETLIAMPHFDTNDNEVYDFASTNGTEDGPYTDEDGAVTDPANVTVEEADDEVTDDGAVTEDDNVTEDDVTDNVTDDGEVNVTEENETEADVTEEAEDVDVAEDDDVTDDEANVTTEDEANVTERLEDGQGDQLVVENSTIEQLEISGDNASVLILAENVESLDVSGANTTIVTFDHAERGMDDGFDNETDEFEDNETDEGENGETELDGENETDDEEELDDGNETDGDETDGDDALTIEGESFDVANLDAPERADVGDTITVTADVTNPNEFETTQNVEYRLEGDVLERQQVTLDANETRTVTFEIETEGLETDVYIHSVTTFDFGETALIGLGGGVEEAEEDGDDEAEVERNATLNISDRTGNGTTLAVDDASANVDFYVDAHYDGNDAVSEVFQADTTAEDVVIELDSEIAENTTVDVAVHAAEDDEELAAEEIQYTVESEDDVDEDDAVDNETDGDDLNETDGEDTNETDGEPTASVEFMQHATDGTFVVVNSAELSDGGFIAIHDADGAVIGASEYLEAGTHEDVRVELDDPIEEDARLTAMPHLDTNDNQEFDFPDGDGPYTEDGDPVTDEGDVSVE